MYHRGGSGTREKGESHTGDGCSGSEGPISTGSQRDTCGCSAHTQLGGKPTARGALEGHFQAQPSREASHLHGEGEHRGTQGVIKGTLRVLEGPYYSYRRR